MFSFGGLPFVYGGPPGHGGWPGFAPGASSPRRFAPFVPDDEDDSVSACDCPACTQAAYQAAYRPAPGYWPFVVPHTGAYAQPQQPQQRAARARPSGHRQQPKMAPCSAAPLGCVWPEDAPAFRPSRMHAGATAVPQRAACREEAAFSSGSEDEGTFVFTPRQHAQAARARPASAASAHASAAAGPAAAARRQPSPFAAAASARQPFAAQATLPPQQQPVPGVDAGVPAAKRTRPGPHCRIPVHAAAAAAQAVPTRVPRSRQLSRGEAATAIQSAWRRYRLARHRDALRALGGIAEQLTQLRALYASYKDAQAQPVVGNSAARPAAECHLSHQQYAELNELAMRVLLKLDATPCGASELRAVRKRLTSQAIALLDLIQAGYSAAVNASVELPDAAVASALRSLDAAAQREAAQPAAAQPEAAAVEAAQPEAAPEAASAGAACVGAAAAEAEPDAAAEAVEAAVAKDETAAARAVWSAGDIGELPGGVRIVFVLPGSRSNACTQTEGED